MKRDTLKELPQENILAQMKEELANAISLSKKRHGESFDLEKNKDLLEALCDMYILGKTHGILTVIGDLMERNTADGKSN